MRKYLLILLPLILLSCKKDIEVEYINLYDGASDIKVTQDNKISFLSNLLDYNNIPALCFADFKGQLLDVIPIEVDINIDVRSDKIRTFNNKSYLNLLYESKDKKIVIDSYNKDGFIKETIFNLRNSRYGSLFYINNRESLFVRSRNNFNLGYKKNYYINYYILNSNLKTLKRGVSTLGSDYPLSITMFNKDIYYVTEDKILSAISLSGKMSEVYNFKSNILEIKQINSNLVILLEDSLFMINNKREVYKEYNLIDDVNFHDYKATSIVESNASGFIIQFKKDNSSLLKSFTIGGNLTGTYRIEDYVILNRPYFNLIGSKPRVIFSTKSKLYIKAL